MMQVELARFEGDVIFIDRYPFMPGSLSKSLAISSKGIAEADIDRCVLRVADELIYLPGWPRDKLLGFCESYNVPIKARYDVWADILAPFVDTSYTRDQVIQRENRLKVAGYGWTRVSWLRFVVAVPMFLYQGIAGEWTGLCHYDLMQSLRFLRLLGLYGAAYRAAMGVALEPYSAAQA